MQNLFWDKIIMVFSNLTYGARFENVCEVILDKAREIKNRESLTGAIYKEQKLKNGDKKSS